MSEIQYRFHLESTFGEVREHMYKSGTYTRIINLIFFQTAFGDLERGVTKQEIADHANCDMAMVERVLRDLGDLLVGSLR